MKHTPCLSLLLAALVSGCGDDASPGFSGQPLTLDAASEAATQDAGSEEAEPPVADATAETVAEDAAAEAALEAGPDAPPPALTGFIGSPCASAADCTYADAVCVTGSAPGGFCSLPCATSCPDSPGHPVTSCVEAAAVPEANAFAPHVCVSRCNFGPYPDSGCRPGYGCVKVPRLDDPTLERFVCLPNRATQLPDCYFELGARGVAFEPHVMKDDHPDTNPELTCHVDDPLYLESPVHGVTLESGGKETKRVLGSCRMAGAVVSTADDLVPHGVVAMQHMGTYNCRVIAGTSKLSQHASGDAIDFGGFRLEGGVTYTLKEHWEHDDTTPSTPGGKFLYAAAHRWYDKFIWNIILTPNYNAAHDDHFHVDMTDGSHYIGFVNGHYIGPNVYGD